MSIKVRKIQFLVFSGDAYICNSCELNGLVSEPS